MPDFLLQQTSISTTSSVVAIRLYHRFLYKCQVHVTNFAYLWDHRDKTSAKCVARHGWRREGRQCSEI